jgi:hypothetical protein
MSDLRTAAQQALERPNLLGWSFHRNSDGSIGIKSPPPRPGESKRTSDCVYPCNGADLHELLSKFVDHIAALEQEPEQEPVAWIMEDDDGERLEWAADVSFLSATPTFPLYTHPPRREWRSLSEEEIQSIHDTYHKRMGPQEFARAVEVALKERNA